MEELLSEDKPIVAIMYDFDKTLSKTDMQNFKFISDLGMTPDNFWGLTTEFSNETKVERILSYMYVMIREAKKKGIKMTREYLNSCGKDIEFFRGVITWFKRINDYGANKGVKVEHYLISSGTKEIVEGCAIFKEFTKVYGCEYLFDENGEAFWPKNTVNYTQKTQFYFRIHKGAIDETDDSTINTRNTKNRVPYRNMIYIGDGITDVAAMTLVTQNGGHAIAVYSKVEDSATSKRIYEEERVKFMAKADYSEGSKLDKVVKLIIDSVSISNQLDTEEKLLADKVNK